MRPRLRTRLDLEEVSDLGDDRAGTTIGPRNRRNNAVHARSRSLALSIATSGPVSTISIGALRELLAQDLLRALGKIRRTVEQPGDGEVPHRLVRHPVQVDMLRAHRHEPMMPLVGEAPPACVAVSDPVLPGARSRHWKGQQYPDPQGPIGGRAGIPMTLPVSSKIFTIFEGTSEIQRMIIGRAVTGLDVR
jgi:hypothetical protein